MPSPFRRLVGALALTALARGARRQRRRDVAESDDGHDQPEKTHEGAGVRWGAVLGVTGGFALFVGLALVGISWFYQSLVTNLDVAEARPWRALPQAGPSTPRLQIDPAVELAEVKAGATERLMDLDGGTLPIDAAMVAVVARGALAYAPLLPAETDGVPHIKRQRRGP